MSKKESTTTANHHHGAPNTLSELFQSMDIDEGCVIDMEKARGVTSSDGVSANHINAPLDVGEDMRSESISKTKDSGLSSRMSETDAEEKTAHQTLLLDAAKGEAVLNKRLARISECQYEEPCNCSPKAGIKATIKVVGVFGFLYLFICTLDLLSNAFRLLGGKTAGSVFSDSELLLNPITGLMIGVLATVLLQSSSTSSSIVITMVASNILEIQPAIPIIMGANIGTTVTNTLVSLAHSLDRKEFRRAFSGAVVHDVFNWLTVLILLPLEYCTGYLYHLTNLIVSSMSLDDVKAKKQDLLKKITKPLTSKIVAVDKKVITGIAEGKQGYANKSLLKEYCTYDKVPVPVLLNMSSTDNVTGVESWEMVNTTELKKVGKDKCDAIFNTLGWGDTTAGAVLFILSILLLSFCLYCMVKLLHSLLGGQIAKAARKTINADFPRPFHWLTGYVAIVVGAGMTILVQSSSVFTSALTPLVGVGCLKLERMFPLTLGSNIGTTFTGVLAALAANPERVSVALQLAFCHLFFNITGILIFYPVPRMRKLVLSTAKYLGRTTAKYRWFAIAYLFFMFILFPVFFFGISLCGKIAFIVVVSLLGALALTIVVINVMQKHKKLRNYLPPTLRNWKFLPECLRSLKPYDQWLRIIFSPFTKCCCQCCLNKCKCLTQDEVDMGCIDTDSEDDSVENTTLPSVSSSKVLLNSSSPNGKESNPIYKLNGRKPASPKVTSNRRDTSDNVGDSHTLEILLQPNGSLKDSPANDSNSGYDSGISGSSPRNVTGVELQPNSDSSSDRSADDENVPSSDSKRVDMDNLRESKI